jgi:isoleucyl-tRNA synthetase
VTSKPADEVRRQVLIPLWNSYAFFVNYARLDGFDPSLPQVPVTERPEIDRWILSNLQTVLKTANERFCGYDTAAVCKAAAAFIDDLSNWYIRRNRRRFWRSRKESESGRRESAEQGAWDVDKLAAYQTLYKVLVTLTKALAPVVPFLCERMYQNLVCGEQPASFSRESKTSATNGHPASVHLCSYPQPDESLIDAGLSARMAIAQRVVSMGLRLRDAKDLRVRQPLAELRYAATDELAAQIAALEDVIDDELNVKLLRRVDHLDDLVRYTYKPNLKTLGPKYGKLLNALRTRIPELGDAALRPLRGGEAVTVTIDGADVTLAPEDVMIATEQAGDWSTADEPGLQIALSTALTPELVQEGMARDFVRHVQQARKDADLEITDRIRVCYSGPAEVSAAVGAWKEYIARETLADAVEQAASPEAGAKSVAIGETEGAVWIDRA